jgi:hypothetical protein
MQVPYSEIQSALEVEADAVEVRGQATGAALCCVDAVIAEVPTLLKAAVCCHAVVGSHCCIADPVGSSRMMQTSMANTVAELCMPGDRLQGWVVRAIGARLLEAKIDQVGGLG